MGMCVCVCVCVCAETRAEACVYTRDIGEEKACARRPGNGMRSYVDTPALSPNPRP